MSDQERLSPHVETILIALRTLKDRRGLLVRLSVQDETWVLATAMRYVTTHEPEAFKALMESELAERSRT